MTPARPIPGSSTLPSSANFLDFKLKPSKAQHPSTQQKLLGVILKVDTEGIRVSADPNRVRKLRAQITDILVSGILEPETASRLARKLSFVNSIWSHWGSGAQTNTC